MSFRLLVLGAVQGLTEFVPVSSSGHLVLVPFVLGWPPDPGAAFEVAVHLGTAAAVVAYFHRELWGMARGVLRTAGRRADADDRAMARLALLLAVGSVPAALAGLLLESFFEGLFEQPAIVALLLLGTAALLWTGDALDRRRGRPARDLSDLGIADAVVVGAFQALAIAPGISRSGATIVAGLGRGLARDGAARFAFLLGLPAFIGAGILQLPEFPAGTEPGPVVAAAAVAAVVGFAAIAFLVRYLRTRDLRPFAVYCVLAAAVGLGYWAQIK